LKGISFLPRTKLSAGEAPSYEQMPYEAINEETYKKMMMSIKTIHFQELHTDSYTLNENERNISEEIPDKFCDTSECSIGKVKNKIE
jgi:hypothetical protein